MLFLPCYFLCDKFVRTSVKSQYKPGSCEDAPGVCVCVCRGGLVQTCQTAFFVCTTSGLTSCVIITNIIRSDFKATSQQNCRLHFYIVSQLGFLFIKTIVCRASGPKRGSRTNFERTSCIKMYIKEGECKDFMQNFLGLSTFFITPRFLMHNLRTCEFMLFLPGD